MNADQDYLLALKLQEKFNNELLAVNDHDIQVVSHPPPKRKREDDLNSTQNIVHPEWETVDPTPDVYALFGAFDNKFFHGKLKCVTLEWSKKMYSCAGICYQRRNRMGMECIIRLSEPLLKLRQRKDLVETLLHEMIHAYLFVLNIREGNGGHGPNFQRIMQSINKTAGTNITVYHTFHDEVNVYKTHVWRCNGLCQHRKPFFGYVRRTCNRAPGPSDQWWPQHQATCGGYFAKISEPEPKKRGPKSQKTTNNPIQNIDNPKWGLKKPKNPVAPSVKALSSVRTITVPTKIATVQGTPVFPLNSVGGNLKNVVGFKDLNGASTQSTAGKPKTSSSTISTSGGHKLGGTNATRMVPVTAAPAKQVRDSWSSKFIDTTPEPPALPEAAPKKPPHITPSSEKWEQIDDDVQIKETKTEIIQLSDDSDNEDDVFVAPPKTPNRSQPYQSPEERQKQIKREILESDDEDANDSDIELIDDDYNDDALNASVELSDSAVIDDIFSVDTLMADFNEINGVIMQDTENIGQPGREIISCPICTEKMCRDILSEHLNGCLGIRVNIRMVTPGRKVDKSTAPLPFKSHKPSTSKSRVRSEREILEEAGYSNNVIARVLNEKKEERQYNKRILNEIAGDKMRSPTATSTTITIPDTPRVIAPPTITQDVQHACPICQILVLDSQINDHLDTCLQINGN